MVFQKACFDAAMVFLMACCNGLPSGMLQWSPQWHAAMVSLVHAAVVFLAVERIDRQCFLVNSLVAYMTYETIHDCCECFWGSLITTNALARSFVDLPALLAALLPTHRFSTAFSSFQHSFLPSQMMLATFLAACPATPSVTSSPALP
eukprot:scaffold66974_cov24-Tisochrysis_lutea.AAC.1